MLLKQEWECRVSHILNQSNDTVIYIYSRLGLAQTG